MPSTSLPSSPRKPSLFTRIGVPVALTAALALAACGSAGQASASAPGVDQSSITIGAVLDTAGPLKVICQPIYDGDQLYINKTSSLPPVASTGARSS